jgi:protein-S-isoprenylcysteine O-methyltransferase Ste14
LAKAGTWIQRWRVPFGFIFAVVFIVFSRPTILTLLIGFPISLIGLAIRAWASGHIRKNSALAISGPYAFTRNPLYLGSFFLGLGATIATGRWWLGVLFAILFFGIYLPVMRVEESELTAIFGNEFREYAEAVPLFFPRLTRFVKTETKFDSTLYLRYREYRAAMGLAFAFALLILKAILLQRGLL